MNINRLLKDISIRHACKNIGTYVAELEKSLGIKLKLGRQKYEYVYEAKFNFWSDARAMEKHILEFGRCQTLFSIEKCSRNFGDLRAVFKFHPENAL